MPGIHHSAIVTADVEASMRFWRDGLGFVELFDYTFTGDWPTWKDAIWAIPRLTRTKRKSCGLPRLVGKSFCPKPR